ncbi:hypothetical protein PoB_007146300 [Plakobranchus ocellatus]|uniref:Uncharacterized protein n=1 Tax=Plakobranchus ocellatus TaxID=259542 RepID=A0AAV4DKZ6_9GAST|nr:hypothetical protein PoB_007146300 [Plakobranchus ocellatus]
MRTRAVAYLVEQFANKSKVGGSNPSPGQVNFFIAPLCPPSSKWVARSLKTRRNLHQGDLRLSGPLSGQSLGQGVGGGAPTSDRSVTADLGACSAPTPPHCLLESIYKHIFS